MLRLLTICSLLGLSLSFNIGQWDEDTYRGQLMDQGFSDVDVEMFMQEYRDAQVEVNQKTSGDFVRWAETQGYYECDDLRRSCEGRHGKNSRKCTGCRKPKLLSLVCEEQDCPTYEPVEQYADRCGFEARRMLPGAWAMTTIDIEDIENGKVNAYWRLFRYFNKANNQGVRIAKTPYVKIGYALDGKKITGAEMAFYIPSAFKDNLPEPTEDNINTFYYPGDIVLFNRAYGGEPSDETAHALKHYKLLLKALAMEESVSVNKGALAVFQHIRPGCGNQRTEVAVAAADN